MSQNSLRHLFFLWSLLLVPAFHSTSFIRAEVRAQPCSVTFQTFAYGGWRSNAQPVLPESPWIEVPINLPDIPIMGSPYSQVNFARVRDGIQEIWLSLRVGENLQETPYYLNAIYYPHSDSWEVLGEITDQNSETGYYSAFVAEDGEVWAAVVSNNRTQFFPEFARFNETTRQFENIDVTSPFIPFSTEFGSPRITQVIGHDHTRWSFIDLHGIYRLDTVQRVVEQVIELDDVIFSYAAIAPDGSLYFSSNPWTGNGGLEGVTLYHFTPSTGQLETVALPANPQWPDFAGLFVDADSQLWLGVTGYRDVNQRWHLLHPNPDDDLTRFGDPSLAQPVPFFQSSDGRIWYQKQADMSYFVDGTAWYDPQTGEGCMVTTEAARIIEDDQRNLWMVAGQQLYTMALTHE